jgi:hypothetical protein
VIGAVSAVVTRHQHLIAALLVVALAVDLLPQVDYPRWLVEALGIAAAALGISRPTEVAANLATSLKQRGGFIATGLAAYLVAAAQSDEAPEPAPAIDVEVVAETPSEAP